MAHDSEKIRNLVTFFVRGHLNLTRRKISILKCILTRENETGLNRITF